MIQSFAAILGDTGRSSADRHVSIGTEGLNVKRSWTTTTPQSCTEMNSALSRSTTSMSRKNSQNSVDENQGVPLYPTQVARLGLMQDLSTAAKMPNHSTLIEGVPPQHTATLVSATNIWDPQNIGNNRSKHVVAGQGVKGGGTDPPSQVPSARVQVGESKCSKMDEIYLMKLISKIAICDRARG